MPIQIKVGALAHTFELDKHFLNLVEREMLSVPPYSSRQGSSTCTTRIAHKEITLTRPVVRHVEYTPSVVVVIGLRHLGRVSQDKPPAFVEILPFASRRRQSHQDCCQ